MHENATLVRELMGREKVRPLLKMTEELKDDVEIAVVAFVHAADKGLPKQFQTTEFVETLKEKGVDPGPYADVTWWNRLT